MRQRILSAAMALAIAVSLLTFASAAEVQRHEVPVTLTVVNTERKISVTVPAALPVSLVDGDVVTATNAAITNQAQTGSIRGVCHWRLCEFFRRSGNHRALPERLPHQRGGAPGAGGRWIPRDPGGPEPCHPV